MEVIAAPARSYWVTGKREKNPRFLESEQN